MPDKLHLLWRGFIPLLFVFGLATSVLPTESTVPPPGLRENTPSVHVITCDRIFTAPGQTVSGLLVIRDGVIVAVGPNATAPADAREWDMTGKTIYPGLIDAYSQLGSSRGGRERAESGRGSSGSSASEAGAKYWNQHVTPQRSAADLYTSDSDVNSKLRSQGVTARVVAPGDGLIKGTSAVVSVRDGDANQTILAEDAALNAQLTNRGLGREGYPDSPMGAMALFRQAFYDAQWYRSAWDAHQKSPGLPRSERNDALAVLQNYPKSTKPVVIDAANALYCLRADQMGREFGLNVVIRGSGNEYKRLDAVAATGRAVILPLDFPEAPNVATPEDAMAVRLDELMHWDIAPENAGRLARAGVPIAFTTDGLKDKGAFLSAIRTAVKRGLDKNAALKALTVTPASIYGVERSLGTLAAGKAASFLVADGDLFEDGTKIIETWVDGERFEVESTPLADLRGTWELTLSERQQVTDSIRLVLKGKPQKLSGTLTKNAAEAKLDEAKLDDARLGISFGGDSLGWVGVVRMSATQSDDSLFGLGVWSDETEFTWAGRRIAAHTEEPDTTKREPVEMAAFPVNYPLGAFGVTSPPSPPDAVLFRNGTVWTCGPDGILESASVLVRRGKIAAVGTDVSAPSDALVVDLNGKHITPGVIDCHSHIATDGGINESGQTISAEVRISDFIDPNDIQIYRQLGGGVTCAHILHGSANTIGGQDQVIKLRWGVGPEELKFANAPPGIKWALGENPKQSNWGDNNTTRYPQTRMGVEQLIRDEFLAARDYQKRWSDWRRTKRGLPPRRDLELDAVVEILEGKRLVHCHAYRQDEMVAAMRVCEEFGVTIKTFDHVLEGYKIADDMVKHGVAGTSFSDWWAYKFEVYDAIPYNGALMHNAGVSVSFNSDSGEMARRLNTEAAKAVKYGGVSEADALKFVTYNAAEQLGIEDRVGSIEAGKDADLAIWNGPPLSSLTMCEQTWIDGAKYFDREEDKQRQTRDQEIRATLIQKILKSGDSGGGGKKARKGSQWPHYDVFCGHADHDHEEEGR